MRRCYVDTSALRHLLIPHSSSRAVRRRLSQEDTLVASSEIAVTELLRLASRVAELPVHHVDALVGNIDLVALTREQLRAAGLLPDLAAGAQLRSLDAIHVQAALELGATEFLTSDRRQAAAAKALGLTVTLL